MSNLPEMTLPEKTPRDAGGERNLATLSEVMGILYRMDADKAWDMVLSRDLDPKLIQWVAQEMRAGKRPPDICRALGFSGVHSKQWKKIQAYFRQGFRADAETYLVRETRHMLDLV